MIKTSILYSGALESRQCCRGEERAQGLHVSFMTLHTPVQHIAIAFLTTLTISYTVPVATNK